MESIITLDHTFSTVFDASHDAMALISPNSGKFAAINDCHSRLFGYSLDGLNKLGLGRLYQFNSRSGTKEALNELKQAASCEVFLWRASNHLGGMVDIELTCTPIEVAGKPYLLLVSKPIAETDSTTKFSGMVSVERAFHDSEAKWRSITENSADHIMLIDSQGTILYINHTVAGLTIDEVIGQSCYNYVKPEQLPLLKKSYDYALKTGQPQNETKHGGKPIFEELYANQTSLGTFLDAMTGFQAANFAALAEKFDFEKHKTVSDVGGALALLSRIVGAHHPHLKFTSFDLPPVMPLAQKQIKAAGMEERITAVAGDFFKDELPKADVITMGNILHDWNLEKKKVLIRKAYDALPKGGALIAIENVIDDARRENVFGLLMSLNMLIEFGDAFDYTGADFREWCTEAGFQRFDLITLTGPTSAAIAYK